MLRMYRRWAERRGFAIEIDELSPAEEAGISSATFIIKGRHAYGLLSAEKGVHRLVRISPFDSQARRQTSFASFDAVPALDEAEEPERPHSGGILGVEAHVGDRQVGSQDAALAAPEVQVERDRKSVV